MEIAREKGLYSTPTARAEAVVRWARSIFGEQGFFWFLFALGGLSAGMWLDSVLRRNEPQEQNRIGAMAHRMGHFMGLMPHPEVGHWEARTSNQTDWLSELGALYTLMLKAGFTTPPLDLREDREANLNAHRIFLSQVAPFLQAGQVGEAKAKSYIVASLLTGKMKPGDDIPIYEMPSLFKRLLGEKPKLVSQSDIDTETGRGRVTAAIAALNTCNTGDVSPQARK